MDQASGQTQRVKHNTIILTILVVQLLLPLRYYVGDDPFDERFAWRMFSPIRMVRCKFQWQQGSTRDPLRMTSSVHAAWSSLMQRARMDVAHGFAAHHCAQSSTDGAEPELYLQLRCVMPDGEHVQPVDSDANLCEGRQ